MKIVKIGGCSVNTKLKKYSGCTATSILLKRELKGLEPMLRRAKFAKRRNPKKSLWKGFSEDLFCN